MSQSSGESTSYAVSPRTSRCWWQFLDVVLLQHAFSCLAARTAGPLSPFPFKHNDTDYAAKMKNAKLHACFSSWHAKVAQVVRLRVFMRRLKNSDMYRCFFAWQEMVRVIKTDRRRREASVKLQSFFRGRSSARDTETFKRARGSAARKIQATFRGKRDRTLCDHKRREVARAKRHEKRHARSQRRREKVEMCIKKEQLRLDKERQFVRAACAEAEKAFIEYVARGKGRRDLVEKRDAIVISSRQSFESIGIADAELIARTTMLRHRLDEAKREAIKTFRESNPVAPLSDLTPNMRVYVTENGHLADIGIVRESNKSDKSSRGAEQAEVSKRLEARRLLLEAELARIEAELNV